MKIFLFPALLLVAAMAGVGPAFSAAPAEFPVGQYNVVWETPSQDASGSMPLGNGDVGLNAWVERDGDLHFYISKTDAWDDNARLVKIGKVQVHFEPNPFADGQPFCQTLRLRDGTVQIQAGSGPAQITLELWADANHPVIHLTSQSPTPIEATAILELWRTNQQEVAELQVSDVLLNRALPDKRPAPMIVEPDTVLTGELDRIGWYHRNVKSVGPKLLAEIQGLTGFPQEDPLLHRTFGAVLTAADGQRSDDARLRSPRSTAHRFTLFVLTRHPATPEQWLAEMDQTIRRIETEDFAARRAAHATWWEAFWNRSWIRATTSPQSKTSTPCIIPTNSHPVRIGLDQAGGNPFTGELGRISVFARALTEPEIQALAQLSREQSVAGRDGLLFSTNALGTVPESAAWDFTRGCTIETWINPAPLPGGGARLVDKITPGGSDGFLLDTFPGNSLRLICGSTVLQQKDALPPGRWTHVAAVADLAGRGCRLYLDGKLMASNSVPEISDEAAYVSQMYHLQRFVNACAGRGAYPVKFNGSIFTVPPPGGKHDADYRRWGPGYWWQNTRLPYFSMCASGDFDLMQPLFRMYADQLLELCKFRTRLYCGHEGAFYPECIYFWGAIFSETYGWTPFEQRQDKLQESHWHKWEWVGGLELCWLMLDYYEHTLDRDFLRRTALPFAREILTFFEQHYPTNEAGQLVMQPAQALETWWDCTNPMPELAGCLAVSERLLTLPVELAPPADRLLWQRLRKKLPPLPLRDIQGEKALAPAEKFAAKQNIENPELYAVFPFRLIALSRPNLNWGSTALQHRWDKGNFGWRQDDIFMAYLGLTNQTRQFLIGRALNHDRGSRFPAFWGPNYDWIPDQDHGGVLMKTLQAMLLQTDGPTLLLLPAWPQDWDVDFKLHAPQRTIVAGTVHAGQLTRLEITPPARAQNIAQPRP
jgi:hypothetical protein